MNLNEYAAYDGLGLAALVRERQVTPRELTALALQAIEQVNEQINAVIARVVPNADAVDEATLPAGPFHGVPFLIKDLVIHAAGVPSESGSRLFTGIALPYNSELMARFQAAGVVTIGRTNTPELGVNASTEPVLHGPTRNPYNLAHSPGGSSGGSAAAVAAGIVPLAHANDGGGSIRIPAACCGLVGLKPSRGRVSLGPDYGEALLGHATEFAVTRTVRDCAALFDAVIGPAVGDPFIITPPERSYSQAIAADLRPLRIAFTTNSYTGAPIDPACVEGVRATALLLATLGHHVEEAAPPVNFDALLQGCLTAWSGFIASACETARHFFGRTPSPEVLEATTWACYQHGVQLKALDVFQAQAIFNQLSRAVAGFMQNYDVLLTPTLPAPPAPLGVYNANDPTLDASGWINKLFTGAAHFTGLCNITGQPAISLPLHQHNGLPIGMQFAARLNDEATLLQLAAQLEQAQPWQARRPHISL